MAAIIRRLGLTLEVNVIPDPGATEPKPGVVELLEATQLDEPPPLGEISAASGQAAFDGSFRRSLPRRPGR